MLHYWSPAQEGSYTQACMKDNTGMQQLNRTLQTTRSCKLITGIDLRPDLVMVRSAGNIRLPGTLLQANGRNKISNRRRRMAIDREWQKRLINRPPTRHVLTGCLQPRKLILFKIKRQFWRTDRKGYKSADVSSVKDAAVHHCCCCCYCCCRWDQDLCYCCYCQLERGYLWKEAYWGKAVCVHLCAASADVSVVFWAYIYI